MIAKVKALVRKPALAEADIPKYESKRKQLPKKSNSLVALQELSEGDNKAFDILTDVMMLGEKIFTDCCEALNDMNMRGPQIVHAFDLGASWNFPDFVQRLNTRPPGIVSGVNNIYKGAERAVERGAHDHMHIKPPKTKIIKKKK